MRNLLNGMISIAVIGAGACSGQNVAEAGNEAVSRGGPITELKGDAISSARSTEKGTAKRIAEGRIFECSFGRKRVSVSHSGNTLIYRFGTSEKPELTIEGRAESANVFYAGTFGTLDYSQQLRFVNGSASYVLSDDGLTSEFNKGNPGSSMLRVYDGENLIAKMPCKHGGGFTNVEALLDLPEDDFQIDE